MDFFRAQENARRASKWLVWWFSLCVIGVVIVFYLLSVSCANVATGNHETGEWQFGWVHPDWFLIVFVTIGGLIACGSLYKLSKLSAGGAVIARDLGGREINRMTQDIEERRLINIVEEMAIAAGVPMPGVWVMDHESGINAFAAGTDPANAVIGVTRGTLERLSRDELQGVIAHEFSHILNGDMRLNMRLTGWIFGLLMVVILGRVCLELGRMVGRGRSKESGGFAAVILVVGVVVWLVGTIGAFFARWLQAAVSRQREYLADAAAVQFTRNPNGIANALRKVGGAALHGAVLAAAASEARHLFFAKSDSGLMSFSLATHPPLDRRIRAIFPAWDGTMLSSQRDPEKVREEEEERQRARGFPGMPPALPGMPSAFSGAASSMPESPSLTRAVPPPLPAHSPKSKANMPPPLPTSMPAAPAAADAMEQGDTGIQSLEDAIALVHGALFSADDSTRERGVEWVAAKQSHELALQAVRWHERMAGMRSVVKLAWIDQTLPWLKSMDRTQVAAFIETNRALIELDGEVNLFEFMLEQVIDRNVAIATGLRKVSPMRHRSLVAVEREVAVLIGLFKSIGGGDGADTAARNEYHQHTGRVLPELTNEQCTLSDAADALLKLDAATPMVKGQLLRMCGWVVNADGVIEDLELELLRAVAEAIGAPMPRMDPATFSNAHDKI